MSNAAPSLASTLTMFFELAHGKLVEHVLRTAHKGQVVKLVVSISNVVHFAYLHSRNQIDVLYMHYSLLFLAIIPNKLRPPHIWYIVLIRVCANM